MAFKSLFANKPAPQGKSLGTVQANFVQTLEDKNPNGFQNQQDQSIAMKSKAEMDREKALKEQKAGMSPQQILSQNPAAKPQSAEDRAITDAMQQSGSLGSRKMVHGRGARYTTGEFAGKTEGEALAELKKRQEVKPTSYTEQPNEPTTSDRFAGAGSNAGDPTKLNAALQKQKEIQAGSYTPTGDAGDTIKMAQDITKKNPGSSISFKMQGEQFGDNVQGNTLTTTAGVSSMTPAGAPQGQQVAQTPAASPAPAAPAPGAVQQPTQAPGQAAPAQAAPAAKVETPEELAKKKKGIASTDMANNFAYTS